MFFSAIFGRVQRDVEGGGQQFAASQAVVRDYVDYGGMEVMPNQEPHVGAATRLNRGTDLAHVELGEKV